MISTSNFARCGKNPNAVAISTGVPKNWFGKRFKKLAPDWYMLKASNEDYDRYFKEKLSKMSAREVYGEIIQNFGQDAILLCWEAPNVRCHRRIVAEWFETELGIVVPEFGFGRSEILPYAEMPEKAEKPAKKKEEQPSLFDDLI